MHLLQRDLARCVALASSESARLVEQVVGEDAPQPGQQLRLVRALESAEIAMCLQQRLLNQVGRITLGTKMPAKLPLREQLEIGAIDLEEAFPRLRITVTAAGNQVRGGLRLAHEG